MGGQENWLVALDCLHLYRLHGRVVLGRSSDCTIRVVDPHISRRHCELRSEAGRCRVLDLGARNGVYVNGVRVYEHFLENGDLLCVGLHRFCFKRIG